MKRLKSNVVIAICYKCVRNCPVKAIRIVHSQTLGGHHAKVVDERCILDGQCLLVCPQKAKKVVSDIDKVEKMLSSGEDVVASLTPSYLTAFAGVSPEQVVAGLKLLSFTQVTETAVGAEIVAREYERLFKQRDKPMLATTCPVIVNLVEIHYPAVIPFLSPVVSPMVAHAKYLKKHFPKAKVVFIGPCIAKIKEAQRPEANNLLDGVITFDDLKDWLEEKDIDLSSLPPGKVDGVISRTARLFPIGGGMLKTADLSTDILNEQILSVSGMEECQNILLYFFEKKEDQLPKLVEPLACRGGCLGGPMIQTDEDLYYRREKVLRFVQSTEDIAKKERKVPQLPASELVQKYRNLSLEIKEPGEKEIQIILAKTGKLTPEDELNCGACGYNTCREKAIAVFNNMADPEMCLSYMRQRAERKVNLFLSSIPHAAIVVNSAEIIVEANEIANKIFAKSCDNIVGHKISDIMDPTNFRKILQDKKFVRINQVKRGQNLYTRETFFYEPQEDLAMGLFQDITADVKERDHYMRIKEETIEKTQGVIYKQMEVAQKIASLLGETTAETKTLLTKLVRVLQEEEKQNDSSS